MNNIIFQAVRAIMVLGIALVAFVGSASAAPMLTPATATSITESSATISAHVSNPYKSTAVWFEVTNNFGVVTTVGAQPPLYDGGTGVTFDAPISNLNPGQTYSYRAVAMEGGVTIYSSMSSFTTMVPKSVNTTTIVAAPSVATQTTVTKSAQTSTQVSGGAVSSTQNGAKAIASPAVSADGFTNNNGAAIIGAGFNGGMLPNTLIGWIMLLIVTLVAVLVGHMIYTASEKRRIDREEKEKREAELEEESE